MPELLFDIKPETDQVRMTIRLACSINRQGCNVRYTNCSDSVFTSDLLKKGIGRIIYPGDLRWFTPDLTLLDQFLWERVNVYQQHDIDCMLLAIQNAPQKQITEIKNGIPVLYLPPSPYKALSQGAREADFIEKLEKIKKDRSRCVIIGILEKVGSSPSDMEQVYKVISSCGIANPNYQFIVLTNLGETEEKLFVLPANIAVYRPWNLQSLLPLCHLALTTEDISTQIACTFAHVPVLEFSPHTLRTITPGRLDRQIKDTLNNRSFLIEQQKELCDFYKEEDQRLDELAGWLIQRMTQRKNRR